MYETGLYTKDTSTRWNIEQDIWSVHNSKKIQENKFDNNIEMNMHPIDFDVEDKEDIVYHKQENVIDTEQTIVKENSGVRETVDIMENIQASVDETLDI